MSEWLGLWECEAGHRWEWKPAEGACPWILQDDLGHLKACGLPVHPYERRKGELWKAATPEIIKELEERGYTRHEIRARIAISASETCSGTPQQRAQAAADALYKYDAMERTAEAQLVRLREAVLRLKGTDSIDLGTTELMRRHREAWLAVDDALAQSEEVKRG